MDDVSSVALLYRRAACSRWPDWPPRPAAAQAEPVPGEATFTIFIRGTDVGREQVNLARSGSAVDHHVHGPPRRLHAQPVRAQIRRRLAADRAPRRRHAGWQAGTEGGQKKLQLATSFALTTAINEITQNGVTNSKTDQISARTVVLPTNVFAGYEALAARLANASLGTEIPDLRAPRTPRSRSASRRSPTKRSTTPAGIVKTRKYELVVHNAGATVDDDGRRRRQGASGPPRDAVGQPERRSKRPRRRVGSNADGEEPDGLRRDHPGQRLQHRRHDDQAAGPRTAAASDGRARGRLRARSTATARSPASRS